MSNKTSDYSGNMEQLEEMMPGLEEFICVELAIEKLSEDAEKKRLYFMERLDILRLPPSIPPRTNSLMQSSITDDHSTSMSSNISSSSSARNSDDFAAFQRELSRTLATTTYDSTVIEEEVKVYDDIDLDDSPDESTRIEEVDLYEVPITNDLDTPDGHVTDSTDYTQTSGDRSFPDLNTPVTSPPTHFIYDFRAPPTLPQSAPPPLPPRRHSDDNLLSSDSVDFSAESNPPSTTKVKHAVMSIVEPNLTGDKLTTSRVTSPNLYSPTIITPKIESPDIVAPKPAPQTPTAPNVTSPDSTTYLISAMGNNPPDLPERPPRPPLPPRISTATNKPKKQNAESTGDNQTMVAADDTSTSYESYDEDHPGPHDPELLHKLNIKLPVPFDKRRKKKLNKSLTSLHDIENNFKSLPDVTICGELLYHGKISWSRRLSAVSKQRLLCYKPEKLTRPSFIVPLSGYHVSIKTRDQKRGTDLIMTHPSREDFEFCVEYREWANLWFEHITAAANNAPMPGKPIKLFRYSGHSISSFLEDVESVTNKKDVYQVASNRSMGSLELLSDVGEKKGEGQRVSRMATFANRASNLFESLGKRKAARKLTTIGIPQADLPPLLSSVTSCSSVGTKSPSSPDLSFDLIKDDDAASIDSDCTHKGFMNIYSNFNRKSWGKWLCVVRHNEFMCYHDNRSKQADIILPLRMCEIKHACAETKSEKSLMLLIDGQEKITVEALSFQEFEEWLRVLVRETGTTVIPEGLLKYYIEKEYHDIPDSGQLMMDDSQYSVICDNESAKYLSLEDVGTEAELNFDPAVYTPVAKNSRLSQLQSGQKNVVEKPEKDQRTIAFGSDTSGYKKTAEEIQKHSTSPQKMKSTSDTKVLNYDRSNQDRVESDIIESHLNNTREFEEDVCDRNNESQVDNVTKQNVREQEGKIDSPYCIDTRHILHAVEHDLKSNVEFVRENSDLYDVKSPYDEVFYEKVHSDTSSDDNNDDNHDDDDDDTDKKNDNMSQATVEVRDSLYKSKMINENDDEMVISLDSKDDVRTTPLRSPPLENLLKSWDIKDRILRLEHMNQEQITDKRVPKILVSPVSHVNPGSKNVIVTSPKTPSKKLPKPPPNAKPSKLLRTSPAQISFQAPSKTTFPSKTLKESNYLCKSTDNELSVDVKTCTSSTVMPIHKSGSITQAKTVGLNASQVTNDVDIAARVPLSNSVPKVLESNTAAAISDTENNLESATTYAISGFQQTQVANEINDLPAHSCINISRKDALINSSSCENAIDVSIMSSTTTVATNSTSSPPVISVPLIISNHSASQFRAAKSSEGDADMSQDRTSKQMQLPPSSDALNRVSTNIDLVNATPASIDPVITIPTKTSIIEKDKSPQSVCKLPPTKLSVSHSYTPQVTQNAAMVSPNSTLSPDSFDHPNNSNISVISSSYSISGSADNGPAIHHSNSVFPDTSIPSYSNKQPVNNGQAKPCISDINTINVISHSHYSPQDSISIISSNPNQLNTINSSRQSHINTANSFSAVTDIYTTPLKTTVTTQDGNVLSPLSSNITPSYSNTTHTPPPSHTVISTNTTQSSTPSPNTSIRTIRSNTLPSSPQSPRSTKSPKNVSVKSRIFNFEQSSENTDLPNHGTSKEKRKLSSSFSLNFLKHFANDMKNDTSTPNSKTVLTRHRSFSRDADRKSGSSNNLTDYSRYSGFGCIDEMSSEDIRKTIQLLKNKLVETKKVKSRLMDKKVIASSEKERHKYKDECNYVDMDCHQLNRDIGQLELKLYQLTQVTNTDV